MDRCLNCDSLEIQNEGYEAINRDLVRENTELRRRLAAAEAAWERAKLDAAGAAKRALFAEADRQANR